MNSQRRSQERTAHVGIFGGWHCVVCARWCLYAEDVHVCLSACIYVFVSVCKCFIVFAYSVCATGMCVCVCEC